MGSVTPIIKPLTDDERARLSTICDDLMSGFITRDEANALIAQIDPHWYKRGRERPVVASMAGVYWPPK